MAIPNNPTTWEVPGPPEPSEPKAWSLTNKIIGGIGLVCILALTAVGTLVVLGFQAQNTKIEQGDIAIYKSMDAFNKSIESGHNTLCATLAEIKLQNEKFATIQSELIKDVAILKANQQQRLDKERLEYEIRFKESLVDKKKQEEMKRR